MGHAFWSSLTSLHCFTLLFDMLRDKGQYTRQVLHRSSWLPNHLRILPNISCMILWLFLLGLHSSRYSAIFCGTTATYWIIFYGHVKIGFVNNTASYDLDQWTLTRDRGRYPVKTPKLTNQLETMVTRCSFSTICGPNTYLSWFVLHTVSTYWHFTPGLHNLFQHWSASPWFNRCSLV